MTDSGDDAPAAAERSGALKEAQRIRAIVDLLTGEPGCPEIVTRIYDALTGRINALQDEIPSTDERHARDRLGRWLAAKERRFFREYPPDPTSPRLAELWTIKVVEGGTDVGIADRPTWVEAVMAALDQAERLEK